LFWDCCFEGCFGVFVYGYFVGVEGDVDDVCVVGGGYVGDDWW